MIYKFYCMEPVLLWISGQKKDQCQFTWTQCKKGHHSWFVVTPQIHVLPRFPHTWTNSFLVLTDNANKITSMHSTSFEQTCGSSLNPSMAFLSLKIRNDAVEHNEHIMSRHILNSLWRIEGNSLLCNTQALLTMPGFNPTSGATLCVRFMGNRWKMCPMLYRSSGP